MTAPGIAAGEPGCHVAHFAERPERHVAPVGSFLAASLRSGGAAVIFAERHQRARLAEHLAALGIGIDTARRSGALVERDAAAAVAQLTGAAGGVDPSAFETVVGSPIRAAAGRGGPVRVYGEMVGLLWSRGQLGHALALEQLGNELATGQPVDLFCGYPAPRPGQDDPVRQMAALHSAMHAGPLPGALTASHQSAPDVAAFYDGAAGSLAQARQLVRDLLSDWGLPGLVDDAVIVAGELAGNAVRHVGTGFALTLARTPAGVRLGVADFGAGLPVARTPSILDPDGRGLWLVDRLANRGGVAPATTGKAVWAEIDIGG
jgi:hypothetical protein